MERGVQLKLICKGELCESSVLLFSLLRLKSRRNAAVWNLGASGVRIWTQT